MEYVSDKIGEDYKKWENGNVIFLSAPTGSGKTHFIIHTLLPYVAEIKGYILYLVNRTALKEQLDNDLLNYMGLDRYIQIMLYQEIENNPSVLSKIGFPIIQSSKFFIIYDECHYFYNDSTFNTKTEISYTTLREVASAFISKYSHDNCSNNQYNLNRFNPNSCPQMIEIFISATIKDMKEKIIESGKRDIHEALAAPGQVSYPWKKNKFHCITNGNYDMVLNGDGKEYSIPPDYSYIDLVVLENEDSIPDIIHKKGGKWLIFVDSIRYGTKLTKSLRKDFQEKVAFVDAKYSDGEIACQTMQEIVDSNSSKADILIATSVIDNGVSIQDPKLENIIILADNEESFIQMLGRKRREQGDKDTVSLYVCKKNKKHFEDRLKKIQRLYTFYKNYSYINGGDNAIDCYINTSCLVQHLNNYQSRLLNDILTNSYAIYYAKRLFYQLNGVLVLNTFSVERCIQLSECYQKVIRDFEEKGENAFAYTIGGWLGKTEDEVDRIIEESNKTEKEIHRKNIREKLLKVRDKELSEHDNINLKKELKKDLLYFLQRTHPEDNDEMVDMVRKTIDNMKKNERPFTEKGFGLMMKKADLPFFVEITGMYKRNEENIYIIKKAESN